MTTRAEILKLRNSVTRLNWSRITLESVLQVKTVNIDAKTIIQKYIQVVKDLSYGISLQFSTDVVIANEAIAIALMFIDNCERTGHTSKLAELPRVKLVSIPCDKYKFSNKGHPLMYIVH